MYKELEIIIVVCVSDCKFEEELLKCYNKFFMFLYRNLKSNWYLKIKFSKVW